jgi:hypothetical protein
VCEQDNAARIVGYHEITVDRPAACDVEGDGSLGCAVPVPVSGRHLWLPTRNRQR